jgi:hypothetical protein
MLRCWTGGGLVSCRLLIDGGWKQSLCVEPACPRSIWRSYMCMFYRLDAENSCGLVLPLYDYIKAVVHDGLVGTYDAPHRLGSDNFCQNRILTVTTVILWMGF